MKKNKEQNTCFTERPIWEQVKNKRDAYTTGFDKGYEQGMNYARECMKDDLSKYKAEHFKVKVDSLKNICQSGAIIIDAMAHAYKDLNTQ